MRVLVVGGAGYIGGSTMRVLAAAGHEAVAYDNLSRGHRETVPAGSLIEGDLGDLKKMAEILRSRRIEAVMHFAAYAYVGESVEAPSMYWQNNVAATLNLLDAMREAGVRKFVFSSSCATFGNPVKVPMDETHPQNPISPYGWTKMVVERILEHYGTAYGLRHMSLRYFNAAGALPDGSHGEDHDPESHLIPRVLLAILGRLPPVPIFGTDYPTPDGTCIRDYVHVQDLAEAHIRALERIETLPLHAYNLGTGTGTSVKEILDVAERVTGKRVPIEPGPRRAGDPPRLVAANARARTDLGWTPRITDIRAIVESAWAWHRRRHGG
ncbi:MAG: UDP-glucose 4-epimerase GalE [Planctomycetota bacterium]